MALVGSVGDGKTTLLRRPLHGTGTVPLSRVKSERRQYSFIDAPGPIEFLRNLVSSAARVDAAVLVIDAAGSPLEQMLRHSALLRLIGRSRRCRGRQQDGLVHGCSQDVFFDLRGDRHTISENRPRGPCVHSDDRSRWRQPALAQSTDELVRRTYADGSAGPHRPASRCARRFRCVTADTGHLSTGTARAGSRDGSNPEASRSATRFCFLRVETRRRIRSLRPATRATAGMNVAVELDTDVFAERGFGSAGRFSSQVDARVRCGDFLARPCAAFGRYDAAARNRHQRCRCSCPGDTLGTGCGRYVSRSIRRDRAVGSRQDYGSCGNAFRDR